MLSRRRIEVAVAKGISEAFLILGALHFRSSLWGFFARNSEICELAFFLSSVAPINVEGFFATVVDVLAGWLHSRIQLLWLAL